MVIYKFEFQLFGKEKITTTVGRYIYNLNLNDKKENSVFYRICGEDFIAKAFAILGDVLGNKFPINSLKLQKIKKSLTFSNKKAQLELNWLPLKVAENFKI